MDLRDKFIKNPWTKNGKPPTGCMIAFPMYPYLKARLTRIATRDGPRTKGMKKSLFFVRGMPKTIFSLIPRRAGFMLICPSS